MRNAYRVKFYFVNTGFDDLITDARRLADRLGFDGDEMIEAVCKVYDKSLLYPPVKNRRGWFLKVFEEKLGEARYDLLEFARKKKNM